MVYVLEDNSVVDTLPGDSSTWKNRLCVSGRRIWSASGQSTCRDTVYVISTTNDTASTPTHPKPLLLVKAPIDGVSDSDVQSGVVVETHLGCTLAMCDWFGGALSTRVLVCGRSAFLDTTVSLWEQGVLPGAALYVLGDADKTPVWALKMLTGKTVLVPVLRPTVDTVNDMMCRVQDCEGIPPDQQRISEKGHRQLDPSMLLKNEPSLLVDRVDMYLVLRLRGGGGGGGTFFSALTSMKAVPFSSSAPKWRKAGAGLNLEARCANTECAAHKSKGSVIVHIGYVRELDIVALKHGKLGAAAPALLCRVCKVPMPPHTISTCGFVDCDWKVNGYWSGASERHVCKSGTASATEYTRADDGDSHEVLWLSLRITTTPPAVATDCAVGRLGEDE